MVEELDGGRVGWWKSWRVEELDGGRVGGWKSFEVGIVWRLKKLDGERGWKSVEFPQGTWSARPTSKSPIWTHCKKCTAALGRATI